MSQAERAQGVPVLGRQTPCVAQRQGLNEAGVLPLHLTGNRCGHALAPGRQPSGRGQRPGLVGRDHRAGAGDALQQGLAFGIEAALIAQATRGTQARLQTPAGTGFHLVPGTAHVPVAGVVPVQDEVATAQCGRHRSVVVHAEGETGAALTVSGQIDHPPLQHSRALCHIDRQLRVQPRVAVKRRPAQPQQQRAAAAAARPAQPRPQPQHRGGERPVRRQQHWRVHHHAYPDQQGRGTGFAKQGKRNHGRPVSQNPSMLRIHPVHGHQGLAECRIGNCPPCRDRKSEKQKADPKAGFSSVATATAEVRVVGGTGFEPVTPTMSR